MTRKKRLDHRLETWVAWLVFSLAPDAYDSREQCRHVDWAFNNNILEALVD